VTKKLLLGAAAVALTAGRTRNVEPTDRRALNAAMRDLADGEAQSRTAIRRWLSSKTSFFRRRLNILLIDATGSWVSGRNGAPERIALDRQGYKGNRATAATYE
jgi:hypothetical protein